MCPVVVRVELSSDSDIPGYLNENSPGSKEFSNQEIH